MKKLLYFLVTILFAGAASSAKAQIQPDPAHWAYGLKKLNGNTYEVHLQCTLDADWHIYAQKQTKDFIGTATKITLAKTPGLILVGLPAEIGKKSTYTDEQAGITNYELAEKIDFVQKVSIRPGVKVIKGSITYQTCTHQRCLSPSTISFNINIPE